MPRQPSAEIALRNQKIYAEWRDGKSLSSLAEKYDRSPQQIGRICANFHPELEDDDSRALHRGRLEALYEEVSAVVMEPGWKLQPNGSPALDPDGNPAIDVNARIEALRLKLMVLESERKLDARDRPQQRSLTIEMGDAQRAMMADIQRRQQEMGQPAPPPVRGQVIAARIEPPPAGE